MRNKAKKKMQHRGLKKYMLAILGVALAIVLFPNKVANAQEIENQKVINFNGHCYKRIDENLMWDKAKQKCEEMGGHLATITNEAEQQAVEQLLAGSESTGYWIGAKRDTKDDWQWVTGENFEYTYWSEGEPNGSGDGLQIYTHDHKWDDTPRTREHGYICEWNNSVVTKYKVLFNANKGTANSKSRLVKENTSLGMLPKVTRKGYRLKGWYNKKSGGIKVTASKKIKANMTIYAQWTKVSVGTTKVISLKNSKGSKVLVKWNKVKGVKGYMVTYALDKKFKKSVKNINVKSGSTKTIVLKNLKKKKVYYVKVKAYKTDSAGKKVFGSCTIVKKIKITK